MRKNISKKKNNKCRYKRELDTENGRNQME